MCVPGDDPLAEKASLYVDGKDVKLAILEARQRELQKEVDGLELENARLRQDVDDLTNQTEVCLDDLYTLTSAKRQELRVDLTDWEGNSTYVTYSGFRIANSSDNYWLHYDTFTGGDAGDSLSYHDGQQFSTPDADHDTSPGSCAVSSHGAWWYRDCYRSNLNGEYKHNSSAPGMDGLSWHSFSECRLCGCVCVRV
nr:hypothetical protein BaRGS_031264 [Batillaria attramentaria]